MPKMFSFPKTYNTSHNIITTSSYIGFQKTLHNKTSGYGKGSKKVFQTFFIKMYFRAKYPVSRTISNSECHSVRLPQKTRFSYVQCQFFKKAVFFF